MLAEYSDDIFVSEAKRRRPKFSVIKTVEQEQFENQIHVTTIVLKNAYNRYIERICPFYQMAYTLISLLQYISNSNNLPLDEKQISHVEKQAYILSKEPIDINPFLVEKSTEAINREYKSISLNELAKYFNVSKTYLSYVISMGTGCTYSDLLACRRTFAFLEALFRDSTLSLEAISYEIGFSSVHYFSRKMKTFIGITPSIIANMIEG